GLDHFAKLLVDEERRADDVLNTERRAVARVRPTCFRVVELRAGAARGDGVEVRNAQARIRLELSRPRRSILRMPEAHLDHAREILAAALEFGVDAIARIEEGGGVGWHRRRKRTYACREGAAGREESDARSG